METVDTIKKHKKKFVRTRRALQILLVLIIALIIFLQHENIMRLLKWISPGS